MINAVSNFLYYISEALGSIWRNKLVNILSIGTISISLFILGVFLLISTNLSSLVEEWGENVHVNIYLRNDISQNNFLYIKDRIETSPEVETSRYISQQEALQEFKDIFQEYDTLSEKIEDDVFPASFEIKIKDEFRIFKNVQTFVERFDNITGIEDIQYDREWIEHLNTIINLIRLFAIIFGGILILAAISTTANVIKMNIISRKDEIDVMRLVGASNSFIKGPFFFEGLIQGLFAGGIAIAILYLLFDLAESYVMSSPNLFFAFVHMEFLSDFSITLFLLGGMLVGTLGSILSLSRFLKT